MKGLVKRVPVLGPIAHAAYQRLLAARERPESLRMLRNSAHPRASRIADVLGALTDEASFADERVAAIEKERGALLLRTEPLVDGSLDAAGLYDEGVTIDAACRVSKPRIAARMMYLLMGEFRPNRVIELGTNLGISSAYQAAGLAANDAAGRIVTLEASPYRLRLARELHGRVGLDNLDYRQGLFADTLDAAVADFGPFDFAFIDGHHQYEPTLDYFDRIWRHSHADAVFVFDDIRWSDGMQRAWAALQADPRIALAVDLGTVGICVTRPEASDAPREALAPISWALHE